MSTVAGRQPEVGETVQTGFAPPAEPPFPTRRRPPVKPSLVLRYVVLTALGIIFMAPFVYMVVTSFEPLAKMFDYPPTWIPTSPTLANYTGFLTADRPVGRWITNSMFVTGSVLTLQLFFNSLIAYTFAKRTFPGRDFLFFLGLATMMLPAEVTLIPNYLIMKHMPLFGGNDLFGQGGHGWLDSYWALIAPAISSPFGIFLMRQYMKSAIPDQLIDAARIDGAGHFKIYWKIVLPLSIPALVALGIFTFQWQWGDLYGPLIYISSPNLFTWPLGLALFVVQNRTVWNLVIAGATLFTMPSVLLFFLLQKYFIRGISVSASKG
jgi:multiple sugar transport system permease protein